MEKNKEKKIKPETDIKIPLILSFVLFTMSITMGLSEEKFRYWGIEETIITPGEVGMWGIISYHIALIVMMFVFIRFGHSKTIQWVSLLFVFGLLGFYTFNNGSCITETGIYEKKLGETVFYSFEEMDSYEEIKNGNMNNQKGNQYRVRLNSGRTFVFEANELKPLLSKVVLQAKLEPNS